MLGRLVREGDHGTLLPRSASRCRHLCLSALRHSNLRGRAFRPLPVKLVAAVAALGVLLLRRRQLEPQWRGHGVGQSWAAIMLVHDRTRPVSVVHNAALQEGVVCATRRLGALVAPVVHTARHVGDDATVAMVPYECIALLDRRRQPVEHHVDNALVEAVVGCLAAGAHLWAARLDALVHGAP